MIRCRARSRAVPSSAHAPDENSAEEGCDMAMSTARKIWTLDELHSLPDDGNKYELIRGELFVTPPPSHDHETIIARLTRILDPFVAAHGLGLVYHARAVIRFEGSEVEPDLFVSQTLPGIGNHWERAPRPILVVEVSSPSTRRREREQKREFYGDVGIEEYWIIDPERRVVTVIRPGEPMREESEAAAWQPSAAAPAELIVRLGEIFG
jgi:Uma2 family endonuclease